MSNFTMLMNMLEIFLTCNFLWSWLLVFPVSVGMEWNNATSHINQGSLKTLGGCNSVTGIRTNIFLENLFKNQDEPETLRLVATLGSLNTEKGCGRSTYNALAQYKKCGFSKITSLLPTQNAEDDTFVKYVARNISPRGSIDYVFDGGTAVRYPTKQLPNNWFNNYTISAWVFIDVQNERQYILSWSDGDTPYHQNMGFYVKRTYSDSKHITFGFFHTHEDSQSNHNCMIRKKWMLEIDEKKWNFVSLSFSGCSAELSVDGKFLVASTVLSHINIPEKHIQPKFVIGARWVGSVTKYADYLYGRISGLVLSSHGVMNNWKLDCLLECKEKVSLSAVLPSKFVDDESTDSSLVIVGSGTRKLFQDITSDIIYTNNNDVPINDKRSVTIMVENIQKQDHVKGNVVIEIERPAPSITISGFCGEESISNQQSMRLCPRLKISMTGCTQFLDSIEVKANTALEKRERLFITPAYINRYGLNLRLTDVGLVLYGVARLGNYVHLLHHIKYGINGPLTDKIIRKFTISISSYNGIIKSNVFRFHLQADLDGIVITPSSHSLGNEIQNDGFLIDGILPVTVIDASSKKSKEHKANGGIVMWVILGCVFGVFTFVPIVAIGYRSLKSRGNHSSTFTTFHKSRDLPSTSGYVWDEDNLPTHIKIDPSERVSITNDPYIDILLKRAPPETSTIDGSVYSDDDETDFDNDSIRQLEWDCLENNLNKVLDGDEKCSSTQGSRAREIYPEEVFI